MSIKSSVTRQSVLTLIWECIIVQDSAMFTGHISFIDRICQRYQPPVPPVAVDVRMEHGRVIAEDKDHCLHWAGMANDMTRTSGACRFLQALDPAGHASVRDGKRFIGVFEPSAFHGELIDVMFEGGNSGHKIGDILHIACELGVLGD